MSNFFQCYFSRGSGSSCLDDNPTDFMHEPSIFHNKLPGQIMNGSLQCQLQYGADHYQCPQRIVRPYLVFFILCIQHKWKLQTIDLSVVRPYQLHCIIACSNLLKPIQLQREYLGYVHTMPRDPAR